MRAKLLDSKRHEQLLATNPAFRQVRMRKECGPITDDGLSYFVESSVSGTWCCLTRSTQTTCSSSTPTDSAAPPILLRM
jgi:hypothetical protein